MATSDATESKPTNGTSSGLPSPPARLPRELATPPDYRENGRLYHGWHRGTYLLPCDDSEQERMDIYHRLFQVVRNEFSMPDDRAEPWAPVKFKHKNNTSKYKPVNYDDPRYETRVLDLGCGTGIWAIDMADMFPNTTVVGIDLSWIQPAMKPSNLSWRQQDFEYAWHTLGFDSWDMIHMRMLLGSVSDWSEMYHKIYLHLKPKVGWIEHTEIDFEPRCDDNTLPPDSPLLRWYRDMVHATSEARKPIQYPGGFGSELRRLGFVDVKEEVIQIPLNPWRTDRRGRVLGQWFNLAFTLGVPAMSLAPFHRVFQWQEADIMRYAEEVKKDVSNQRYHVYCNVHTWIARKPGPDEPRPMSVDPEELPDA